MTFYRRRLPHWHLPGQDIFITWRLYGSLPRQCPVPKPNSSPGQAFVHYDRVLDAARMGPHWLKDPRIAGFVLSAMTEAKNRKMFNLRAYVLMPNHVHILVTPIASLDQIMRLIKGPSSRQANLLLARTGAPFWQDESFDRWVRDAAEWEKIRSYIERNPVAAGLVSRPEDWPWSSASHPIE